MSRLAAIFIFVGVAVLAVGGMRVFKTNAAPAATAEHPLTSNEASRQRDEFALLHVLPSGRGLDPITLL